MKNTFFKKSLSTILLSATLLYIFAFTITPLVALAQAPQPGDPNFVGPVQKKDCVSSGEEYCLLEPIIINNVAQEKVKIADYVTTMFKIGIGLAALFAVFMIIWGGFQYMSTDAVSGKSEGKEKIEGALWGLALALGSFLILNTINPQLLEFSGGLEPIKTDDLAKRIAYTDIYLENNRKLDAVRTELDECNRKAEELRISGNTDAADAAKLKCKVDVARNSVIVKAESVGIKSFFDKSTSKEEDEKTRKTIFDAGKRSIAQYYNTAISDLEEKKAIAEENDDQETYIKIVNKIGLLIAQTDIDLTRVDQEYDTQRALSEISLFGSKSSSKIQDAVGTIKRSVNERSVEAYNKYKKDYPSEAEIIRVDRLEKIKKIDEAYKEGLERLNNSINSASGPTIGG